MHSVLFVDHRQTVQTRAESGVWLGYIQFAYICFYQDWDENEIYHQTTLKMEIEMFNWYEYIEEILFGINGVYSRFKDRWESL